MAGPGTDIAGEMQDYLMQKGVNTLFVELTEHLLAEKPANVIQFVVEYLSEHYPDMTRRLPVVGFDAEPSDSEPDDHDVDDAKEDERDELKTFTFTQKQRRGAVSAVVSTSVLSEMRPLLRGVVKSASQKRLLSDCLRTCPLFAPLTSVEVNTLVDACRPELLREGDVVYSQGDEGDRIYLVEEGTLHLQQVKERGVDRVTVSRRGGYFGELAVMYPSRRQATARVVETCKLWWLNRATCRDAIVRHTVSIRERSSRLLGSISVFATLTETERQLLADALTTEEFDDGDVIIRQNDPGEHLFVVDSGTVSILQQASPVSSPVELCRLGPGGYFGEVALLTDRPRQASAVALGEGVVCLSIDRRTFRRILGPLQEIMRRDKSLYASFMAQKI